MTLSEKLYALRRKSGLSQEQLAEQLHVSRQSISKWELGQAVPESDKLLSLANYFQVSLDYLMKPDSEPTPPPEEAPKTPTGSRTKWLLGMFICIGGVVCLILWGVFSIWNPTVSQQISQSSMIQIDGNGIFLIFCIAAIAVGAILLLKNTRT